jgi:hypothetical protein
MNRLLVLAVAVLGVITVTAVAPASRTSRPRVCSRHLLPLTANSIGPAAAAALRRERPADRPRVVSAALAPDDRGRGPEARFECGARVWRRTVVVYITLRKFLPSASLSERVDFVGRFRGGYRVWQVVH